MLERLKNLLKPALKTLRFNKKRYVYFVILLIFIQSLISCIFMFNHNNNQNQVEYLEKEFQIEDDDGKNHRYYIVINNLTPEQYNLYLQSKNSVIKTSRYFNDVYEQLSSSTGTSSRYYVYVNFYNDNRPGKTPYELYEMFMNRQEIKELVAEEVVITQTPLLLAYRSSFVNTTVSSMIALLVTALGALTFGILFRTFINHYKFSYGVYMTYGANFKKLLSASLTEMLILNLITFIPSFLISILITYFLTASAGNGISILLYPMFLSLLCSVVLTVVAVTVVIKRVSVYVPDKLLRSVNNESMITSPRRSVRLPEKSFPFRIEMLSMRRFRKYVVTLLLTTLIFAGAFCGGTYLMEVRTAAENAHLPQFELSFPTQSSFDDTTAEDTQNASPAETTEGEGETDSPDEVAVGKTYDDAMREILYGVEGVEKIVKIRKREATLDRKHILIHSDDLTWSGKNNGVESEESGYIGFANVDFTLFDEEVAEGLIYLGATIEGDIQSVLNNKKTIAISDTVNNELMNKLEVGDTIKIARSYIRRRPLSQVQPTSANHLLEMLYRAYDFYYAEYTVGAIVSDMPVGESFPVYMNAETFEEVTGETPYFVNLEVYCADGVSAETVRNMERDFRRLGSHYNMSVSNTRQETVKVTNKLKNYPGLILYISLLLLLIYILLTSLSQTLFYQMRKKELDIYLCLGVSFKQIRKLFWVDAGFFALLSSMVYSFFAALSTWIVYALVHSDSLVRISFHIPWLAFAVGLVVVVLTSVLSVMLAYLSFKRRSAPVFTGKAVLPAIGTEDLEERNEIFDSDAR